MISLASQVVDQLGGLSCRKPTIASRARDPDDVAELALRLHLPVWTNGHDFEDSGVEWHTTAERLTMPGIESD